MAKRQRGRESAGDMIRSLGLVLAMVVVVFLLAQPPGSDEKRLRLVDPAGDVKAFSQVAPGGAVPRTMPPDWRSTVSEFDSETNVLRVGWVTPAGHYAEYAAAPNAAPVFVSDITDKAPKGETVDIGGLSWQEYRKGDALSLVRMYGPTTVVLGTLRGTATLDELRVLAGTLAS